jgi:hypothetical protein
MCVACNYKSYPAGRCTCLQQPQGLSLYWRVEGMYVLDILSSCEQREDMPEIQNKWQVWLTDGLRSLV